MKRTLWLSLALSLATSATALAAPINLVINGSFEQGPSGIGSFQGWTTTLGDAATFVDSSGQTGSNYGQASNGMWAAYFGSSQAKGGATIAETLATTAGQLYTLTFDLANNNGGAPASNSFAALVAGSTLFSATNLIDEGFQHEQFSFLAASSATTLQFSGFNDQSYTELDNVAVTAATPEPSSLVLLATGALSCVSAIRARRRSTTNIS